MFNLVATLKHFFLATTAIIAVLNPFNVTSPAKKAADTPQTFIANTPTTVSNPSTPTITPLQKIEEKQQTVTTTPLVNPSAAWGQTIQTGAHEYYTKVAMDDHMATAQEIFTALNTYRQTKGVGQLSWDQGLANYAQTRADTFASAKQMDDHAGFIDFLHNQAGHDKLQYRFLAENSSYGYKLLGVHLIEWIYAGDADHDSIQLSTQAQAVGIAVNGTATDLVFGGER